MGLAVYREPLLRGEWKALWRDSDTVPEAGDCKIETNVKQLKYRRLIK